MTAEAASWQEGLIILTQKQSFLELYIYTGKEAKMFDEMNNN